LGVAYLPALAATEVVLCGLGFLRSSWLSAGAATRAYSKRAAVAIAIGLLLHLMVNGILFKDHIGFRYNNSIPGFVIGQIAPAVRPEHIAAVGLKIEHFEALQTWKLQ